MVKKKRPQSSDPDKGRIKDVSKAWDEAYQEQARRNAEQAEKQRRIQQQAEEEELRRIQLEEAQARKRSREREERLEVERAHDEAIAMRRREKEETERAAARQREEVDRAQDEANEMIGREKYEKSFRGKASKVLSKLGRKKSGNNDDGGDNGGIPDAAKGKGGSPFNVTNIIENNFSKSKGLFWFFVVLVFIIGSWRFGFKWLQKFFNYAGLAIFAVFIMWGFSAIWNRRLDSRLKSTRVFIAVVLCIWIIDMWPPGFLFIGQILGEPFGGFVFDFQGILKTSLPAVLTSGVFFAWLYINMVYRIIDREYVAALLGFISIIVINRLFANFFPSVFGISVSIPFYNMIILTIMVSGLLLSIYLDKKRSDEIAGFFSNLFMIFVISFFFVNNGWTGYPRAIAHAIFILAFGFLYIKKEEKPVTANIMIPSILILDFFGIGWLWSEWGNNYLWVKFIPLLVLFVLFYCYHKTEDIYALTSFIALVTLILILSLQAYGYEPTDYKYDYNVKKGADFNNFFSEIFTKGRTFVQTGLEEATGGYYKSEVEKNQYEPLGVYFDRITPAQPKFYSDEDVTLWSTIRSRTLNDPAVINFTCSRQKEGIPFPAKTDDDIVLPNRSFTVYTLEDTDVECTFTQSQYHNELNQVVDRQKLSFGQNKITLSATYNFETSGYQKMYMIDQNRLRAMTREGIQDALDEFGITDKNPATVHTNGPVEIAVSVNNLIPISSEDIKLSNWNLGILVRNREKINDKNGQPIGEWKGNIKKLNQLLVILPNGVQLDEGSCRPIAFSKTNAQKFCSPSCSDLCKRTCEEYTEGLKDSCRLVCDGSQAPSGNTQFVNEMQGRAERQKTCNSNCQSLFQSEDAGKNYNAYQISTNEVNKNYPNDFTDSTDRHRTFGCRLLLSSEALDNSPITTRYIRVLARYDYSVNNDYLVNVEKAPFSIVSESTEQAVDRYIPSLGQIEGTNVKIGDYLVPVSDLKALIYIESKFTHCCKIAGRNTWRTCAPSPDTNCPANRILTSFDGSSIGLMQINSVNHYLASTVCPQGQTVLDRDCNIKVGLELLRKGMVKYNNGAGESILSKHCPPGEQYYEKYRNYRGFDAVLRSYNGWGCKLSVLKSKCEGENACGKSNPDCVNRCIDGAINYVEKIKDIGSRIASGQLKVPEVPEFEIKINSEGAQDVEKQIF